MRIEIYGLYDPDTNELRYVGKARCARKRLATHISDSRRAKRPVCLWVKSLIEQGKRPRVEVLEAACTDTWKAAERRLIAEYRKTCNLLNLANGGNEPSQTTEQRANAARSARKAADRDPLMRHVWQVKRQTSSHLTELRKRGDTEGYERLRAFMHEMAAKRPDIWGSWASL